MHSFKPAFALKNAHLQTIYSTLFRKVKNVHFEVEQFPLEDGDFVESYWHKMDKNNTQTPLVILFHGLAGSYKSVYVQGVVQELAKRGFDSVLMHFRGCSGKENNLPRSYHSGDTKDALKFIDAVKKTNPDRKLYGVGYSLGANMLLKLLGETQTDTLFEKVVAVSPPMQLDVCATSINKGFSRYYQHRLMGELKASLDKKYETHPMEELIGLKRQDIQKLRTFWEFDEAYTAPIHGFNSAQEYYTKSSAKQYLKNIQIPTLIIHAIDDPFMSKEVIPKHEELSSFVSLEVSQQGGHVGFIAGTIFSPIFWLEKRIVRFFKD